MRVRLTLAGMSDAAWVSHPKGDHVVIPLDGPLDEAAVEAAVGAYIEEMYYCKRTTLGNGMRAAIIAYLRAVGGGE